MANKTLGIVMTITGVIGVLCSAILTIDKIELLKDPGKVLGCDISVWVSCGATVNQPEASAFGFPNTLIGLVGFAVIVTLGVLLASGVALPRWVWVGLQGGLLFGIGFVTWLQSQAIYDLHVLCPYCMVVWSVMIPLFVTGTGGCLRALAPDTGLTRLVTDWWLLIIGLWFVAVAANIWFQFGSTVFN